MSTSGTIGQTVIQTNKILEKAIRRCGLFPASLTPEIVEEAVESLYMLLLSLSNRGLNLWCVERNLLPLIAHQARYTLPVGTLSVLNVLQATPQRVTGTVTSDANNYQVALAEASKITRFGIKFSVLPTTSFDLQVSQDGATWTTVQAVTSLPTQNVWGWYDVDPSVTGLYFRAHSASLGTVSDLYLATSCREVVIAQFNRDDYANQPAKTQEGATITNYYFEKLIDPTITYWPVPNDDTRHVVLFRHREVQDIGRLTQEIEIPARWYEAICWHLAARLAFEIPGVDPGRRKEVLEMSQSMLIEVEAGETDSAPIYFAPNLRGYTR